MEDAIDLHENPTKFLSTVQVAITSISVLNGIIADAAFSEPVRNWLRETMLFSPRAAQVSATAFVVLIITVLTIIFGELVPKRIGQMFPERVAAVIAPPMQWISAATRPKDPGTYSASDASRRNGTTMLRTWPPLGR